MKFLVFKCTPKQAGKQISSADINSGNHINSMARKKNEDERCFK